MIYSIPSEKQKTTFFYSNRATNSIPYPIFTIPNSKMTYYMRRSNYEFYNDIFQLNINWNEELVVTLSNKRYMTQTIQNLDNVFDTRTIL